MRNVYLPHDFVYVSFARVCATDPERNPKHILLFSIVHVRSRIYFQQNGWQYTTHSMSRFENGWAINICCFYLFRCWIRSDRHLENIEIFGSHIDRYFSEIFLNISKCFTNPTVDGPYCFLRVSYVYPHITSVGPIVGLNLLIWSSWNEDERRYHVFRVQPATTIQHVAIATIFTGSCSHSCLMVFWAFCVVQMVNGKSV